MRDPGRLLLSREICEEPIWNEDVTAHVNKLMMMKLHSTLWQARDTLILYRRALLRQRMESRQT